LHLDRGDSIAPRLERRRSFGLVRVSGVARDEASDRLARAGVASFRASLDVEHQPVGLVALLLCSLLCGLPCLPFVLEALPRGLVRLDSFRLSRPSCFVGFLSSSLLCFVLDRDEPAAGREKAGFFRGAGAAVGAAFLQTRPGLLGGEVAVPYGGARDDGCRDVGRGWRRSDDNRPTNRGVLFAARDSKH
jgi:hypothetical protein